MSVHQRFMHALEAAGELDRALEFLPSDAEIARREAEGYGLLSPEKISFASGFSPTSTCSWLVTLQGKKFVPVEGSPFCGEKVG